MDTELQRPLSFRLSRRGERNNQHPYATDSDCLDADDGGGFLSSRRLPQDNPIKIMWKQGFIRLVFVAGILWMLVILVGLLFHVFSCQSSFSFFSAICNKESKVFISKDLHGLTPKAEHRKVVQFH